MRIENLRLGQRSTGQPPRTDRDGDLVIRRVANGDVLITETHDGQTTTVLLSEHNAWSTLAGLALMLDISMAAKLGKVKVFGKIGL